MLQKLQNKHRGAAVAVVASGPSASMALDAKYDVSIGVNGAALLGRRFDYFLCGDHTAHLKDWFAVDCSNVRIIARIVATMDRYLYPDQVYPKLNRVACPQHQQYKLRKLSRPVSPHLTFKYKWYRPNILSPQMNFLMFTGTISCCAAQLALIMGAECIDLFGCNFYHGPNKHYFYAASADQIGRIRDSQRTVMDSVLREIRNFGVKVRIFGDTRLTQFDEHIL